MKTLGYTVSLILLLIVSNNVSAQIKLGSNPVSTQKSSLLELESDRQGLLFPRLSDTAAINALNPPDGMVIYFTPTRQIMVKAGGAWQPLSGASGTLLLSNLGDVLMNSPSNGQLLKFNGTKWINFTPSYLTTIDTVNIANFYTKVRSLINAGAGINYNNNTGTVSNTGVLSLNGNTGALTMDTGYIANFYQKVRSLSSATAPITYANGAIGITQAGTGSSGYLSSIDWNTFNNKANAISSGNLTETGSGVLTITGGTGSVLGTGTTLQVKQANTSQNGFLSSADWNTFNNKLSTVDTNNITNFSTKVRGLISAGTGIGYNAATGVVSNSGVVSLNGNTGALTMDTGYIADFSTKVRGLSSGAAPITYNNGAIGITQANATTNGYLSSADWNIFSSKGGGSVTSVAVTTANGVSGTVTNPTTTPAISLTLGAITPSSVAATGTVTGSNLSGTNTGDVTLGTPSGLSLTGQQLSLGLASTTNTGALSSTDWNTFNNKLNVTRNINTTAPLLGGGSLAADRTLSIADAVADGATKGASTYTANDFNSVAGLIGIDYTNGQKATAAAPGFLTAADWTTFNNKANAASISGSTNYITKFTSSTAIGNSTLQDNGLLVSTTAAHGILATGTFGTGGVPPIVGAGTRMMWMPSRGAFRAGTVSGVQWDSTYIGNYSVAMGQNSIASGNNSVAFGTNALANTQNAISIGTNNTSSNSYATSLGYGTSASGNSSTSMGNTTVAAGDYSTAMGHNSFAGGNTSLAIGNSVTATGSNATAIGSYLSTANQAGAMILGDANTTTTYNDAPNQLVTRFSGGYKLFTDAAGTTSGIQITPAGLVKYNADYSGIYDNRTLVDKAYVDGKVSTGAITSLNGLNANVQTFAIPGTSGTAPNWNSATSIHTLNIPMASSGSVTAGLLSNTDWNTFNNKLSAVDTTNISGFSTKVRSLFSGMAPITYTNGTFGITQATTSTNGYLSSADWNIFNSKGGGSVTSVAVTTANGVSGTVTNPTTTPAISLTLGAITPTSVAATGTITGSSIIKAGGTAAQFLKADGSIDANTYLTTAGAGAYLPLAGGTLTGPLNGTSAVFSGTVTASNITGTNTGDVTLGTASGLSLTGQQLSLGLASTTNTGALSNTDWNTFNNKLSTTRNINTTAPLLGGGNLSADRTLSIADAAADGATKGASTFTANDFNAAAGLVSIDYTNGQKATGAVPGFLTPADWTTFNNKANAISSGNLTETGSGVLTITGGTGSVLGTGTTVQVKQANTTQGGFLSNTDWNTFNSKLSTARTINTTAPLLGGGDLSADRTLAIADAVADGSTKGAATFLASDFNSAFGLIGIDYANAQAANTTNKGLLTAADWNTFNSKLSSVDTTNIANFSSKVRGLFSGTAPITYSNGAIGITQATTSTNGYLSSADWNIFNSKGGGSVTSVAVTSANGVSGTVTNPTTTPAISLTLGAITPTSVTASGTMSGSNLSGTNTGDVTLGTASGLSLIGQQLSLALASTTNTGALSTTDWNTFNNKLSTTRTISTTAPLQGGGDLSANRTLSITDAAADGTTKGASTFTANDFNAATGLVSIDYINGQKATAAVPGFLTAADWTTFNNKANAISSGNLTETGSGVLTITGGTGSVLGAGTTVQVKQATGAQNGFLTSGDWTTFNNKLSTVDTTNISGFSTKVRSLFTGTAPITYANGAIGITQATTSTNGYLSNTDWNTFNNKANAASISGTINYIPKFTSGSAIGNSALQDNGSTITTPELVKYNANYSSLYDARTMVDKGYVDSLSATMPGNFPPYIYTFNKHLGIGTNSLNVGSSGNGNVAYGDYTLSSNTSGQVNTAIGSSALYSNTTGIGNSALGSGALNQNISGNWNTGLGYNALNLNQTGNSNTAVGNSTLSNNTTGPNNTASGYSSLNANITGGQNTATGNLSLRSNTSGNNNTANGNASLQANTAGNSNVSEGVSTLYNNTIGSANTAMGWSAMYSNVSGSNGVAIGNSSQYYVNNTGTSWTNSNTSIGFESLRGSPTASANTGNSNTALGYRVLLTNNTGSFNTGSGYYSLSANTTGNYNSGYGYNSLFSNTSGVNNTSTGSGALYTNTTGSYNTANGLNALYLNTNGNYNTASGQNALYSNTTGANNVAQGYNALNANTTGTGNTAIGYNAFNTDGTTTSGATLTNATAIGNYAQVTTSNSIVLGGTGSYVVNVGIGTTAPAYELDVQGTNPLRLLGVQAGATSDSILTITSGVVKKLAFSAVASGAFNIPYVYTSNVSEGIGRGSLNVSSSGTANVAYGDSTLTNNTTGLSNTAIGYGSLKQNTTGIYNTAVGYNTLVANTAGTRNTAVGFSALTANTTGSYNTALGQNTLSANTTGANNTAAGLNALNSNTTGNNNAASGYSALFSNTTGTSNTASGANSLYSSTTGINNTAAGFQSLYSNIGGNYNTATGVNALYANTGGNSNNAYGFAALSANTTGSDNTAMGQGALTTNTTGNSNNAYGNYSLNKNTTGINNVAIGNNALLNNTTASNNTGLGTATLFSNTTGINNTASGSAVLNLNTTGSNNTASGFQSLSANTTGNSNTATGVNSLLANTTGSSNTANGVASLAANTTGYSNTAMGLNALTSNTTGYRNTAIGDSALRTNGTGTANTAVGWSAMFAVSTGSSNTASGFNSLSTMSSGNANTAMGLASLYNNQADSNTAVGYNSLKSNTTGVGNTAIGLNAGYTDGTVTTPATLTNSTAIGFNAQVTASNAVVLGGTGSYAANVGVGTTAPAQKLDVVGNVQFSKALMPGGDAGMPGAVLTSSGPNMNPEWLFPTVAAPAWSLTGNAGTTAGTNFIGTTDNVNLVFKRNGVQAGLLTSTNTSFGVSALNAASTGLSNIAIGASSLAANTTGSLNMGVGISALSSNTTGTSNTAVGINTLNSNVAGSVGVAVGANSQYYVNNTATPWTNYNTSVGHQSLQGSSTPANNTGNWNTAIGYQTLLNTTSGSNNVALGSGSLSANTTGSNNVASGAGSLYTNTTGTGNVATGYNSLTQNTTGSNNVATGTTALALNSSGGTNVATGFNALYNNSVGSDNVAVGTSAFSANVSGSKGVAIGAYAQAYANNTATPWTNTNTSVGYQSLQGSIIPANNTGLGNTAIGYQTLLNNTSGSFNTANGNSALVANTTGTHNTGIGNGALLSNTTGTYNTASGFGALQSNSTGIGNTANGFSALYTSSTGGSNTANGYASLYYNTTGFNNAAIGYNSLYNNTTGSSNSAVGLNVLINNSTGSNNAAVGQSALASNTTGIGNTAIGVNAGYTDGTVTTPNGLTNATAIGYMAQVTGSNEMVLGGTGTYGVNVGIGTADPAYKLDIKGNNPLRLLGVQVGAITDSILTITSGVVKKLSYSAVASGSSWGLTGNAGTTAGTNFIGTTDDKDVVFKRNGVQAGLLSNAGSNTSWGVSALNPAVTGTSNTAIGFNSLTVVTTGANNVTTGYSTLSANTTGNYNVATGSAVLFNNTTGSNNTGTGGTSLLSNTVGANNTANGYGALSSNVSGSSAVAIGYYSQYNANNTATPWTNFNTSVGYQSLLGSGTASNNTGNYNSSLGYSTLMSNSTGGANTALGYTSLAVNSTGSNNTALGSSSLAYNTTGSSNTGTGQLTLYSNTIGSNNTALGQNALYSGVAGSNAVAIGYNSQYYASNTTTPWTNNNTSIGYQSLRGSLTASANTGTSNTALGYQTLLNNTSGSNNIAIGTNAMTATTNGSFNAVVGDNAMLANTTGAYNTVLGAYSLAANTIGNNNTGIGYYTLNSNLSGINGVAIGFGSQYYVNNTVNTWANTNTSVGYSSLLGSNTPANNTGVDNTALGYQTLMNNTSGSGITAIGYRAGYTDGIVFTPATITNATAIGNRAQVTASNSMVLGGTGAYAQNVGIGTTAPAYKLDVNGTTNISGNLTGTTAVFSGNVTANSDIRLKKNIQTLPNVSDALRNINAVEFDRKDVNLHQVGFIAQNVQKYFPSLVTVAKDSAQTLSLNYQAMTSPLLKGWQEHDEVIKAQQTQINDLKKELDALKQVIEEIKKRSNK